MIENCYNEHARYIEFWGVLVEVMSSVLNHSYQNYESLCLSERDIGKKTRLLGFQKLYFIFTVYLNNTKGVYQILFALGHSSFGIRCIAPLNLNPHHVFYEIRF